MVQDDVTFPKVQIVQDLATFAVARYLTHPLPLKLMLYQKSGFF